MSDQAGGALGVTAEQVAGAESALGVRLPNALRAAYRIADGRFRDDGQWWVVWPLDRLVNDNRERWAEEMLPRAMLAFGDDGTGDAFCVRLEGAEDQVVRWSSIGQEIDGSFGTMEAFLSEWAQ